MDHSTNTAPDHITQAVSIDLVTEHGSAPAGAELLYDPRDPYAVTAKFTVGETDVSWTFARDLLVTGLLEPTGDGDIHVRPGIDSRGHAVTMIELHSPDGAALVQARASDLHRFVDRMTMAVRPGTESRHMNVDATITELLVADLSD